MRHRALLLAAVLLPFLHVHAPARALDPTVLVATRADGSLVRLALTGRLADAKELVHGDAAKHTYQVATQANGTSVAYTTFVVTPFGAIQDVSTVDATSGKARRLSHDGRSGFLLVSRDGRYRYVLRSAFFGPLSSVVRTDTRTGKSTTLLSVSPFFEWLSGASLSPDGRTLYIASTVGQRASNLLAIDTATGKRRVVRPDVTLGSVFNLVASPDGATLAASWADTAGTSHVSLVPLTSGAAREVSLPLTQLSATSFTRDGSEVVLTAPFSDALPVTASLLPGIWLAEVTSGAVTPVLGTDGMFQAVTVA